jgi:hypothetical protein
VPGIAQQEWKRKGAHTCWRFAAGEESDKDTDEDLGTWRRGVSGRPIAAPGPCIVGVKKLTFQDFPLYQIFAYMHKVLNIDKK